MVVPEAADMAEFMGQHGQQIDLAGGRTAVECEQVTVELAEELLVVLGRAVHKPTPTGGIRVKRQSIFRGLCQLLTRQVADLQR